VSGGLQHLILSGPVLLAIPVAAAAGAVTFLSPCCLPLVPGYLSYLTGMSGAAANDRRSAAATSPAPAEAAAVGGTGGSGSGGALALAAAPVSTATSASAVAATAASTGSASNGPLGGTGTPGRY
jgi:cytochrome c-type biogenesis protein